MECTLQRVLITSVVAGLMGCVAIEPSQRAQRVIPAYPEMVAKCSFLGGVTGCSQMIGMPPLGEQLARFQALDEAAKLGATHIVWTDIYGGLSPTANGRAYYCDPDKDLPRGFHYVDQYLRIHRYPFDGEKEGY
ncbi:MAG TPA: hypothetical protein PLD88_05565 [Candidatus Berkiella sp.]|nr:hypothetical protein [Candidatus Berkiella sp.]